MPKLLWSDWLAFVLVIVGALNWGLVGLLDFNLVTEMLGVDSALSNVIFVLVGVSGVYLIIRAAQLGQPSKTPLE